CAPISSRYDKPAMTYPPALPPPLPAQDELPARRAVEEAASSTRMLGIVFVALGGILALIMFKGGLRTPIRALVLINVLILVGPGVWYFLAAEMIRRLDGRAATV